MSSVYQFVTEQRCGSFQPIGTANSVDSYKKPCIRWLVSFHKIDREVNYFYCRMDTIMQGCNVLRNVPENAYTLRHYCEFYWRIDWTSYNWHSKQEKSKEIAWVWRFHISLSNSYVAIDRKISEEIGKHWRWLENVECLPLAISRRIRLRKLSDVYPEGIRCFSI